MPLVLILGLGAGGLGYFLGLETNKLLTVAVIGGVTYVVLKNRKII